MYTWGNWTQRMARQSYVIKHTSTESSLVYIIYNIVICSFNFRIYSIWKSKEDFDQQKISEWNQEGISLEPNKQSLGISFRFKSFSPKDACLLIHWNVCQVMNYRSFLEFVHYSVIVLCYCVMLSVRNDKIICNK